MITVRVPATTANLGPGFDCFGMALSLYGEFKFEEREEGLYFENVEERFQNTDNLAVRAYKAAMDAMELEMKGLYVGIHSDIPVSRGLGSSASLIAAGIAAASAAHGNMLSKMEQVAIATRIEGHPDNVAPAILGGLTISSMENKIVNAVSCPVADQIKICVLIPDFELTTAMARSVLPKNLSYQDAVFNIAHGAQTIRALETGDGKLLRMALRDRLHQPYRASLIPDFERVKAAAEECGTDGLCISGAGPTLLCLHQTENFAEKIEGKLKQISKVNWHVLPLNVEKEGARVIREGEG